MTLYVTSVADAIIAGKEYAQTQASGNAAAAEQEEAADTAEEVQADQE